jgi:hypothetical protein
MKFEKGDWIRGRSRDGELIHGYIQEVDNIQNIMKVFVIKSDNEIIIEKSVWIFNKYAEKLALTSASPSEDELLPLIELALLTKDKEWFMELTEALKGSKKGMAGKENLAKFTLNRLENIDTTY